MVPGMVPLEDGEMSKAKRRQYGTGSVSQECDPKRGCPPLQPDPDDPTKKHRPDHRCTGRWVGKLDAGTTERGTRRRLKVVGQTEKIARDKLDTLARKVAREGAPPPRAGRSTVKSWAAAWLPLYRQRTRPRSYASDASLVTKWLIPTIGGTPLDALTPNDVRKVHDAVRTAGRSSTTASNAHDVLMRMLKAARLEGHQIPERVFDTPKPADAVSDRQGLEIDHALAALQVALERDDASRWVAALLQGMRQGECLGLTWDAIDLDAGLIDISWQLQRLPYLDRAADTFLIPDGYEAKRLTGGFHLVRPKSDAGRRLIPIVPWMSASLRLWRQSAPENPWGLVWPSVRPTRGGKVEALPQTVQRDLAAWHDIQEQAGVTHPAGRPYKLHESRHTTATLLLEAGVPEPVIVAIMGHSSIASTRRYQHTSTAMQLDALQGMATRLGLSITEPLQVDPARSTDLG